MDDEFYIGGETDNEETDGPSGEGTEEEDRY